MPSSYQYSRLEQQHIKLTPSEKKLAALASPVSQLAASGTGDTTDQSQSCQATGDDLLGLFQHN